MKSMVRKILVVVAYIYLSLFVIFWLFAMGNIFLSRGLTGVFETLSPFNVANLVVTILFLAPYFVLLWIASMIAPKVIRVKGNTAK